MTTSKPAPNAPPKPQTPAARPTPNDQRSDAKNPNNPAHKAATDNRANQMNPQAKK